MNENYRDEDAGARKVIKGAAVAGGAGLAYAGLRKHPKTRIGVLKSEIAAENMIADPKKQLKKMRKRAVGGLKHARTAVGGGVSKAKGAVLGLLKKRGFSNAAEVERAVELCVELERVEFKDKSTAVFTGLPDDWERRGESHVRNNPKDRNNPIWKEKKYRKPKKIKKGTPNQKEDKDGEGATLYHDVSPSRVRRGKAVAATAAAGGLGYVAGKYGKKAAKLVKKRFSNESYEFMTPAEEYVARQKASKAQLKRESRQGEGALVGAGVVGGLGVARAARNQKLRKKATVNTVSRLRGKGLLKDAGARKEVMRNARKVVKSKGIGGKVGLGLAGAYVGSKIGGAIGSKMRKDKEEFSTPSLVTGQGSMVQDDEAEKNLSVMERAESQLIEFQDLGYIPSWRSSDSNSKPEYPHVDIRGLDKPLKLGQSGKAVIDYKVNNATVTYEDDGSVKHSNCMNILALDPIPAEVPSGKKELSIMERAGMQLQEFAGRSRDEGGRFMNGSSVAGADDFAAAAELKKQRKRRVLQGAAGAAALGTVAGAVAGRKGLKRVVGKVVSRRLT